MNSIKSNAHKLLLAAISDYCRLKSSGEWGRLLDHGRVVQVPIIAVQVDNVEVVRERAEETRAIGEVVWGFLGEIVERDAKLGGVWGWVGLD